jgi:hypothetical protein
MIFGKQGASQAGFSPDFFAGLAAESSCAPKGNREGKALVGFDSGILEYCCFVHRHSVTITSLRWGFGSSEPARFDR